MNSGTMHQGDICICTHTFEVHFGHECSKIDCRCKEFVVIDLAVDLFKALKELQWTTAGVMDQLQSAQPTEMVGAIFDGRELTLCMKALKQARELLHKSTNR